uniref:Uncharacterized protein n=1 Tax=Arundo donax TaxID=35708 RepID=A0A0A9DPE1_ARUDO
MLQACENLLQLLYCHQLRRLHLHFAYFQSLLVMVVQVHFPVAQHPPFVQKQDFVGHHSPLLHGLVP